MRICASLIVSALLTGCSATMVQEPGPVKHSSEYGPSHDATGDRTGVVSYLNEGFGFVTDWRRDDAYQMMHETCDGDYALLRESASNSDPTYYTQSSSGSAVTYGMSSEYVYLTFKCIPEDANLTPPPAYN